MGYYDSKWHAASDATLTPMGKPIASPRMSGITITSFNEWGEGTQIEEARPHMSTDGFAYADYTPGAPNLYMERTREWTSQVKSLCTERVATDNVEESQDNLVNLLEDD